MTPPYPLLFCCCCCLLLLVCCCYCCWFFVFVGFLLLLLLFAVVGLLLFCFCWLFVVVCCCWFVVVVVLFLLAFCCCCWFCFCFVCVCLFVCLFVCLVVWLVGCVFSNNLDICSSIEFLNFTVLSTAHGHLRRNHTLKILLHQVETRHQTTSRIHCYNSSICQCTITCFGTSKTIFHSIPWYLIIFRRHCKYGNLFNSLETEQGGLFNSAGAFGKMR